MSYGISLPIFLGCFLLIKGSFICEDGSIIPQNNLCDGRNDCEDGSDERSKMCFHLICSTNKFRCQYGGCIEKGSRCNGTTECNDGSDENYCNVISSCSEDEFQCFSDENCIKENLVCDGKTDCTSDGSDENMEFCERRRCPDETFLCRHGGCIHNDLLCDKFSDCPDGSDETKAICDYMKCRRNNCSETDGLPDTVTCKPIKLHGLHAICISEHLGHIPCNKNLPIGTIAKLECQEFYLPTSETFNTEIRCQPDGTWNGDVLRCKPECGIKDPAAEVLITYGRKITNWPWQATMYTLGNGEWTAVCGGTLITENVVLTAAHCTWKRTPKQIKFAFYKYYSDFNATDEYTQIKDVEQVIIPPEYLDFKSNYGSDIAVIFLTQPVELSEYVKPACLDWDLSNMHQHLTTGQLGTIAGIGIKEDNEVSKTLQALDLPVVPTNLCIRNQGRDFRKYITHTTFCSGWANGTGVCNGDSGGGLLFRDVKDQNRWILQGIVSVSPRRKGTRLCDTMRYTIFTKIGMYLNWLKDSMKNNVF